MDGTEEFRQGHDGFVIQAALLQKENDGFRPIAGVIYQPIQDVIWYSTETEVSPFRIQKKKVIAAIRKVDPVPSLYTFLDFLKDKGFDVETRLTGSAGHTVACMLNNGPNLYIMPRTYTKEWDLAPAELFISHAGGWISDLFGNGFVYNRTNVQNPHGFIVSTYLEKRTLLPLIQEFGIHRLLETILKT